MRRGPGGRLDTGLIKPTHGYILATNPRPGAIGFPSRNNWLPEQGHRDDLVCRLNFFLGKGTL